MLGLGAVAYGVVPLETSSDGTLFATLNGLAAGRAKITAGMPSRRAASATAWAWLPDENASTPAR